MQTPYIIVVGTESKSKVSDTRVRNFVFTIQENEQATNGETTKKLLLGNPTIKALFIGGLEKAPTTGKLHRHAVVSFHNKKSLEQAIKLLTPHHVEIMRGTPRQALDYALKENSEFLVNSYDFIHDNDNEQRVIELIKQGANISQIMDECPKTMINKFHNIEKLYRYYKFENNKE